MPSIEGSSLRVDPSPTPNPPQAPEQHLSGLASPRELAPGWMHWGGRIVVDVIGTAVDVIGIGVDIMRRRTSCRSGTGEAHETNGFPYRIVSFRVLFVCLLEGSLLSGVLSAPLPLLAQEDQ
eukprot:2159188-Pyramimonas_sp.AAC.1